jgi:hypothetical protein
VAVGVIVAVGVGELVGVGVTAVGVGVAVTVGVGVGVLVGVTVCPKATFPCTKNKNAAKAPTIIPAFTLFTKITPFFLLNL